MITNADEKWTDTGSVIFARTFKQPTHLKTTTAGCPSSCVIQSRRIRSLPTGQIIDECDIDSVSEEVLHRRLPVADDIRVQPTMKAALKLFEREGPIWPSSSHNLGSARRPDS